MRTRLVSSSLMGPAGAFEQERAVSGVPLDSKLKAPEGNHLIDLNLCHLWAFTQ